MEAAAIDPQLFIFCLIGLPFILLQILIQLTEVMRISESESERTQRGKASASVSINTESGWR